MLSKHILITIYFFSTNQSALRVCQVELSKVQTSPVEENRVEPLDTKFIAIADGTYCYIQKSSNNYMQRKV